MAPASPLQPRADLTPAQWLVGAIPAFGARVDELLPRGYPAYVRLFHRPDQGIPGRDDDRSWAQAAQRHGTVLHPAAQWRALTRDSADDDVFHSDVQSEIFRSDPTEGTLDRDTLTRLATLLSRHTETPERCYLALWDGFGQLPNSWRTAPTVALPGHDYLLFGPTSIGTVPDHAVDFEVAGWEEESDSPTGIAWRVTARLDSDEPAPIDPQAASAEFARQMREQHATQSPTLWWPEDHAWIVLSEIDFDSTLIGCSVPLRDALLADPDLECLEVGPDTSLADDADLINT